MSERAIEVYVSGWRLIPSRGGVFEVTVNGDLIFSKKTSKRYPEVEEIREALRKKLKELRPFSGRPPDGTEQEAD